VRSQLIVALFIGLVVADGSGAAPTVWSGATYEFSKPDLAFPPPADELTANVAFTRDDFAGLYNVAQEFGYNFSSPIDTRWATDVNNPGGTITATNYAALTFGDWATAYGGPNQLASNIVGRDAVVHLVSDDIYLDLRFTAWTPLANGGGFTYLRAVPVPEPASTGLLLVGSIVMTSIGRRTR
jgi:hypothetical protein